MEAAAAGFSAITIPALRSAATPLVKIMVAAMAAGFSATITQIPVLSETPSSETQWGSPLDLALVAGLTAMNPAQSSAETASAQI